MYFGGSYSHINNLRNIYMKMDSTNINTYFKDTITERVREFWRRKIFTNMMLNCF